MEPWIRENTFVCLDDITGKVEEYNPVIYNPTIVTSISDRKKMLFNYIKEAKGIELTDDELESVCHYECSSTFNSSHDLPDNCVLRDFVIKLREILMSK